MTSAAPNRLLLIDNDAFVLLAGAGHLDKALAALGLTTDQCRYNATFPFVFRKKIAKRLAEPVVARVNAAIATIRPLEFKLTREMEQLLVAEPGIDAGEALLLGVLAQHRAMLLTTNDRRALRTLSSAPALSDVRSAVSGRIVGIHSIVKRIAADHGVKAVAPGFVEMSATDTFLASVFTKHTIENPEQCLEAIDSYIRHLAEELGDDLLYNL